MLKLEILLIALTPLTPLSVLLVTKYDGRRRVCLLSIAFSLFIVMLFYSVLRWIAMDVLENSLFKGANSALWTNIFTSNLPIIVYMLIVATAGYFANRRALQRVQGVSA